MTTSKNKIYGFLGSPDNLDNLPQSSAEIIYADWDDDNLRVSVEYDDFSPIYGIKERRLSDAPIKTLPSHSIEKFFESMNAKSPEDLVGKSVQISHSKSRIEPYGISKAT